MVRIAVGVLLAVCLLAHGVAAREHEQSDTASTSDRERLERRIQELERERAEDRAALEQRIEDLETQQQVNEDAIRTIIRQTISQWGSRINEFVVLGGTLEVVAGWAEDFARRTEKEVRLNTAELDFEIQVTDFARANMVVQYDDGRDALFQTTDGDERSVDRINLDTAFVTLGDPERFWPFALAGRLIVPFGISTGDPVADVLSLEDPLTVEVFETKEDALLLGVEFPTQPPTPQIEIPAPPPVRPLVLTPLIRELSLLLGYEPFPTPAPAPAFTTPTPRRPPFTAAVYVYNGETTNRLRPKGLNPRKHFGATAGYRTRQSCSYFFCPWSIELDVDYNHSVFDSSFLGQEYRPFLQQVGYVEGGSGSARVTLGPMALVGEWNGALENAKFTDDAGLFVRRNPSAWQVSLAYQLGWNPSVEVIGAQGTYLTVGYSESSDLMGVSRLVGGEFDRVGNVPRQRFLVGAGEWLTENVRIAVEYSRTKDYSRRRGGSGRSADAIVSMLTFEW